MPRIPQVPAPKPGKSRSSRNAETHGLTSKRVVLPHESDEEYAQFREAMIADLAPATELEAALAEVVAETFWRRQRFYRLENAFMAERMKALMESRPELEDGDNALVLLFTDAAEMQKSRLMLRYLTAAERACKAASAALEEAQKKRRQAEREQAFTDLLPDADDEGDEAALSAAYAAGANGFVSYDGGKGHSATSGEVAETGSSAKVTTGFDPLR